MSISTLILLIFVYSCVEARVIFPDSEVIQANDIVNFQAPFNCDNGCKVYVDRKDDTLNVTQNGEFIAKFDDIVGDSAFAPVGIVLPAGENYKLEAMSEENADFVFYIVSVKARNYGAKVFVPQETVGVVVNGQDRYVTILSSFNAIRYYGFNGTYPSGYPRIYSTGFDGAGDDRCTPVYQARSQYNAEQSQPMIFSPIMTIDFGFRGAYTGEHTVIANQNNGKNPPMKNAVSSTVYMSPGFVGCSSVGQQVYFSNVKNVQDSFKQTAESLDLSVIYNAVTRDETVHLRINNDVLDFFYFGFSSFIKTYGSGTFDVELSWTRQTPFSSWAIQMDFGTVPDAQSTTLEVSTAAAESSTVTLPPTSTSTLKTTTSCSCAASTVSLAETTTTKSGVQLTAYFAFFAVMLLIDR